MRVAVLCATARGRDVLERVAALVPQAELIVLSFREEPWEPPFLDDIQRVAQACRAQFHEARHVGDRTWQALWDRTPLDLMLVVSWRYLIPPAVYRRPRLGTFVFHDSVLPAYRGFSPTVWAMVNGEDHTGTTLFEIAEAVDAGDLVGQERVPIGPDDTIATVLGRVTQSYLRLLEQHLPALLAGRAPRTPQDHSRATYTCRRLPSDNEIDWAMPSRRVYDLIRGVGAPYPGAYTHLDGRRLTVWSAARVPEPPRYVGRVPGRVVAVRPGEGSLVLTGDGVLLLREVQPEGGGTVGAAEMLHRLGHTLGRATR